MPTNLYRPERSDVIPALFYRFHQAKVNNAPSVAIWGTDTPKREFLCVDDMAGACVHVMNLDKEIYDQYTEPMCIHINIGTGMDLTIQELAETIKAVAGCEGKITFDSSKPEGSRRKLMDSQRLNSLGWQSGVSLKGGLIKTYSKFLKNG